MLEFLNPSLKPYNALTREEKHLLLDAAIDGNVELTLPTDHHWSQKIGEDFYPSIIYRTKPKEYKKLDIPWQHIDEKWKWAAMNDDGWVGFYETKPKWKIYYSNDWDVDNNGDYCITTVLKLDTTGIVAEHSLTQRPEGV